MKHPTSGFWYGFLRGMALPMYLMVGACDGIRQSWYEFKHDGDMIRGIHDGAPSRGEQP